MNRWANVPKMRWGETCADRFGVVHVRGVGVDYPFFCFVMNRELEQYWSPIRDDVPTCFICIASRLGPPQFGYAAW